MKKWILAIAMVLGVTQAHAVSASAWICSLEFKGESQGLKVILGNYFFGGKGSILCVSPLGDHQEYPVSVTMTATGYSPQVALGYLKVSGQSADITLFNADPLSVLGTYYVAQGQGAIAGGIGSFKAIKVGSSDISMQVSLQFTRGLGFNLGLGKMVIALDNDQEQNRDKEEPKG